MGALRWRRPAFPLAERLQARPFAWRRIGWRGRSGIGREDRAIPHFTMDGMI